MLVSLNKCAYVCVIHICMVLKFLGQYSISKAVKTLFNTQVHSLIETRTLTPPLNDDLHLNKDKVRMNDVRSR